MRKTWVSGSLLELWLYFALYFAGVNALGNRRHRRRVPLPVWFAVAFLVVVLLGCLATIVYVNICGDPEGEEEESQEEEAMNGSWAAVLGGRVEDTGILNRHIEVHSDIPRM